MVQLQDSANSQHSSQSSLCQRIISDALLQHADGHHFCEFLQHYQHASYYYIHQVPSPPITRCGGDKTISNQSSSEETTKSDYSNRRKGDGADDFKPMSIYNHLSEHRRTKQLTLLDSLREAAIVGPIQDHPESAEDRLHQQQQEEEKENASSASIDPSLGEDGQRRNIFDYLAEHRARMDRFNTLSKRQSITPRTEWGGDDHDDILSRNDQDEYNGIDELIFEIEL